MKLLAAIRIVEMMWAVMPARVLLMAFAALYPIATFHDRMTSNHVKFYALALFTLLAGIALLQESSLHIGSLFRDRAVRIATLLWLLLSGYAAILLKGSVATVLLPFTFFLILLAFRDRRSLADLLSSRQIVLLFALIAVVVLGCFANSNQFTALAGAHFRRTGLATFGCCIVLFLLTIRNVRNTNDRDTILTCLLAGSGIIGVIGLTQFFWQGGFILAVFPDLRADPRPVGTFGHSNWYGTYLLLVLPFAVHRFLCGRGLVWGTLCALLYANVLAAQTRGAWIGLAAYLALLLFQQWTNRARMLRLALVFAVVTAALLPCHNWQILKRAHTLPDEAEMAATGSSSAGTGRFGFWKYSLDQVPKHAVIGSGLDTLPDIAPPGTTPPVDKAHSIYLEYAVTIGIPGLILYLAFLWLRIGTPGRDLPGWTFRATLITYLAQGLFIHDTIQTWPLVWMLAGLSPRSGNQ